MIFEVAHQMALLPIVAALLLWRRLPTCYLVLAAAFAVSWLGDSAARLLGGSWVALYVWLPAQVGFALAALDPPDLLARLGGLPLLAFASLAVSAPGPDWMVTLIGSVAIIALAKGPLRVPVWLYFGAGSAAYFWMLYTMHGDIMPAWYTYQGCRLLAFLAFIGIAMHHRGVASEHVRDRDPARAARPAGVG